MLSRNARHSTVSAPWKGRLVHDVEKVRMGEKWRMCPSSQGAHRVATVRAAVLVRKLFEGQFQAARCAGSFHYLWNQVGTFRNDSVPLSAKNKKMPTTGRIVDTLANNDLKWPLLGQHGHGYSLTHSLTHTIRADANTFTQMFASAPVHFTKKHSLQPWSGTFQPPSR